MAAKASASARLASIEGPFPICDEDLRIALAESLALSSGGLLFIGCLSVPEQVPPDAGGGS